MADPAVLFVCLGNICRSPLAEAAFRLVATAHGRSPRVASAGTGDWHVGYPADPRAIACAARNAVALDRHCARQVTADDFTQFDYIVALDHANLRDLKALAPPDATARLSLLLDHVPGRAGEGVADPYHGDDSDFDRTWQDVLMGTRAFAAKLFGD